MTSTAESRAPWTASGMRENNAPLENRVRTFLSEIIENKPEHARFLNMLSMLEHLGSRKIMLSQMDKTLNEDTLKHLAEEARHAYFFKRHAERIAKKTLNGWNAENTYCPIPAKMYFGRLDATITKSCGVADSYYWVSLIIELRACWLYALYQEVLEKSSESLSLKSLLAEEDMHLADMFSQCGENHAMLKTLSAAETSLFIKLWAQIEAEFTDRTKQTPRAA